MKYLIKFTLHAALVFAFIALATAAFIPMAKAEHSPPTSGVWLVIVDWDDRGNPSIKTQPRRFEYKRQCTSAAATFNAYAQTYNPDQAYVSVCAYPDDETAIDEIIDSVIEDFRKYFKPVGQGV